MDETLERLRDQLRRLDMETEAQVLFRQERQGPPTRFRPAGNGSLLHHAAALVLWWNRPRTCWT